jgi:hypothetical protein
MSQETLQPLSYAIHFINAIEEHIDEYTFPSFNRKQILKQISNKPIIIQACIEVGLVVTFNGALKNRIKDRFLPVSGVTVEKLMSKSPFGFKRINKTTLTPSRCAAIFAPEIFVLIKRMHNKGKLLLGENNPITPLDPSLQSLVFSSLPMNPQTRTQFNMFRESINSSILSTMRSNTDDERSFKSNVMKKQASIYELQKRAHLEWEPYELIMMFRVAPQLMIDPNSIYSITPQKLLEFENDRKFENEENLKSNKRKANDRIISNMIEYNNKQDEMNSKLMDIETRQSSYAKQLRITVGKSDKESGKTKGSDDDDDEDENSLINLHDDDNSQIEINEENQEPEQKRQDIKLKDSKNSFMYHYSNFNEKWYKIKPNIDPESQINTFVETYLKPKIEEGKNKINRDELTEIVVNINGDERVADLLNDLLKHYDKNHKFEISMLDKLLSDGSNTLVFFRIIKYLIESTIMTLFDRKKIVDNYIKPIIESDPESRNDAFYYDLFFIPYDDPLRNK